MIVRVKLVIVCSKKSDLFRRKSDSTSKISDSSRKISDSLLSISLGNSTFLDTLKQLKQVKH